MNPIKISCKENEWRKVLEGNLRRGDEVDLVSFNGDYDADDCSELARKHSMIFEWPAGKDYAFFRKANFDQGHLNISVAALSTSQPARKSAAH
jgi:hypothetical protein